MFLHIFLCVTNLNTLKKQKSIHKSCEEDESQRISISLSAIMFSPSQNYMEGKAPLNLSNTMT